MFSSACYGHFLWVSTTENKPAEVRMMFSEAPHPGEAHLADRIRDARLLVHSRKGSSQALTPKMVNNGDRSWWQATATTTVTNATAEFQYGIYKGSLLNYYARHVDLSGADKMQGGEKQPEPMLKLDILPLVRDNRLQLNVSWNQKPLPEAEITLWLDDAKKVMTTGENGRVTFPLQNCREVAVLASYILPDSPGSHNGQPYQQERHYSSLTVRLSRTDASQRLARARANRAVWKDFPGFRANLVVNIDGQETAGSVVVDAGGDFRLELDDEKARRWCHRQIAEMVTHRMPSGELSDEARFVEPIDTHPLGRRLRLSQDAMGSEYRVKQDVVTQVNRSLGDRRFTISVLEVTKTVEGKYLPKAYTVSFWDTASGELLSTTTAYHQYHRLGAFDLPRRIMQVEAGRDSYQCRVLDFRDLELLATSGDPDSNRDPAKK